jgi:hypothetical protein
MLPFRIRSIVTWTATAVTDIAILILVDVTATSPRLGSRTYPESLPRPMVLAALALVHKTTAVFRSVRQSNISAGASLTMRLILDVTTEPTVT